MAKTGYANGSTSIPGFGLNGAPILMFVHGGGLELRRQERGERPARFCGAPWLAVGVGGLSPGAPRSMPARCAQDVADAVAWMLQERGEVRR